MQCVTSRASPRSKAFHVLAASFRGSFSGQVRREAEQGAGFQPRVLHRNRTAPEHGRAALPAGQTEPQPEETGETEGTCAMRTTVGSRERQFLPTCIPPSPRNRRRHGRVGAVVQPPA